MDHTALFPVVTPEQTLKMSNPVLLAISIVFLFLHSCGMKEEHDQMSHRAFLQSHAFAWIGAVT